MAEFKTGDRVVFTKDDDWLERGALVRMPKGTLGTYLGTRAWREAAPWVRLDTGEHVLACADAIAPAEDHGTGDGSASDICAEPGCNCDLERRFPAPLDPAKVAITIKGGDYIEAESDGAKIGGKVSHVTERGFVAIEHLGEFAIHHITAAPLPEGYRMYTLTAHTPAPEPEPGWEPGDMAAVTARGWVNGWSVRTAANDGWASHDASDDVRSDAEVEDVRPLVVIDPADVDVVALQREIDDAMPGHEASVALAHLGLNR
jgi:hypothetical protein